VARLRGVLDLKSERQGSIYRAGGRTAVGSGSAVEGRAPASPVTGTHAAGRRRDGFGGGTFR
jgi:hypothetical protein